MRSLGDRSVPRVAALVLAGALVAASACGGGDDAADTSTATTSPPATTTTTAGTTTTTAATPTTAAPETTTTTAAPPPPPPAPTTLAEGDRGPAVADLQRRLSELGYWVGTADGVFGDGTSHAVVALQKAAGIGRDGVVGPATRRALDAGIRPVTRSTSGRVVEIDLARQLLVVVDGGRLVAVFDTSTGSVPGTTPAGRWSVTREIDGLRQSELGLLYRPKYFYEGVAVHGYTSVPPYPASHGCVRVTYPAMDHIWAEGYMPIGTPVWVY